MDQQLIEEKLEALRHCIQRVQEKCPASADALMNDADVQDIVSVNLTRAVQLCVDIAAHVISESNEIPPSSMAGSFDSLLRMGAIDAENCQQMKRAVGFRNVAVHQYQAVDWNIVFSICTRNIDDFRSFASTISRHLHL